MVRAAFQLPQSPGGIQSYLVTASLVAASTILQFLLEQWLGPQIHYIHSTPAIMFASWYGGFGPGLFATAASALATAFFFLPPVGIAVGAQDLPSLAIFTAIGAAITLLNDQLRAIYVKYREEAALAKSREQFLAAVINTTVDGIIVIDERGRLESFNPGAERLFGYSEAEVKGQNIGLLMPAPYRDEHDGYLRRYSETGRARVIGIGREVIGQARDGTTFPLHLSVAEFTFGGQRRYTGILHDLRHRVQLEEQVREATAMARLGEMAAVLAHEVKNPLAGIRGAIQVVASHLPAGNQDRPVVDEIVVRIDALTAMMRDLLLFARPPKPRRVPTDLVTLVAATARLLKQDDALRNVEVMIEGTAPPISADGEMLKMVFQNLLINGAHAMAGKGTIRIHVTTIESMCQIGITDSGPGIPADIREKVFVPFFTTKARGTGLGLPTAKRFVEVHNGHIRIEYPPAGGTTVFVQLPFEPAQ